MRTWLTRADGRRIAELAAQLGLGHDVDTFSRRAVHASISTLDPQRSSVRNGSKLLAGIDGRSVWVRRCKDIIEARISDVGGEDNCGAAERSIGITGFASAGLRC
jgi:hypothetical protein